MYNLIKVVTLWLMLVPVLGVSADVTNQVTEFPIHSLVEVHYAQPSYGGEGALVRCTNQPDENLLAGYPAYVGMYTPADPERYEERRSVSEFACNVPMPVTIEGLPIERITVNGLDVVCPVNFRGNFMSEDGCRYVQ